MITYISWLCRTGLLFFLFVMLLSGCGSPRSAAPIPAQTSPAAVAPSSSSVAQVRITPTVVAAPTIPATAPAISSVEATGTGTAMAMVVREATAEPRELVERLRSGGNVIFFRHAATDFSKSDSDRKDLKNCETQRNLSPEGREDARAIGSGFNKLGIPVGKVLSSPYCRTLDTARLAFGRVQPSRDLLSLPSAMNEAQREELVETLRRLLSTPPPAGENTVLVGHLFSIQAAVDVSLAEGEASVWRPGEDGRLELIGSVLPSDWAELARTTTADGTGAEFAVEEYDVPAGSHPHDVAPAPDGSVWYTAQPSGELGNLDPSSGKTRHVPLGEGSAPHGVIVGPDGAPWITDSGLNAIVRVDPKTSKVRSYPLPEDRPDANLNTATFDTDGILWFTGQNGVYGSLDPMSGEMKVYDAPRGPGPYGIATTPKGDVYYASLAGSHIARIDTESGKATVIEPRTAQQGARRVWSDSRGRIWVSEWDAGQVGVYDPATKQWKEWKLPGEDPAAYAVYVDSSDKVWLSEFTSDTLVRFDPEDESFQTFELTGDPAFVRQILGRPGEIWGAESAADKLVVVRTQR